MQSILNAATAAELAALDGRVAPFDVHAHTGVDIDGTRRTSEEHLSDLAKVQGRSVIFPLCVAGGYEPDNRRILEECAAAPDRLVPFARLDPRVHGAGVAAAEALAAGARGIKLHPRAEDFRLDDPDVDGIFATAAEARAPVLIHAGLGVGVFGSALTELADRHPSCPIILAHAGISDLAWLWRELDDHPNLFFDTSWWNPADLIALFALVPPGRILFGSDEPYMDFETVLALTVRCARYVGLSPESIDYIVAGGLDNLLAGGAPIDLGPAPGMPEAAPGPTANRAIAAITATGAALFSGGDPTRMLEMVQIILAEGGDLGETGRTAAALLDEATQSSEGGIWALALALALLATPGVESATPASV